MQKEREMWRRVGEIKGGVPLGYSTLGGFTISDQLDDMSGFRGGEGGREDSGCVVKGYQGIAYRKEE